MVTLALIIAGAVLVLLMLAGLALVAARTQVKRVDLLEEAARPPQPVRREHPAPAAMHAGAEDVSTLLSAGRRLEAIKLLRQQTGLGLDEAKRAVAELERGRDPRRAPAMVMRVDDASIDLEIRAGRMINAVKLYREMTGVGLKEAKQFVDARRDRMRMS